MFRIRSLVSLIAAAFAVPAFASAANYTIDQDHTHPSIEVSHMGISTFRGEFEKTTGLVTLDRAARTGTVGVTIDAGSIDFGVDKLNTELRGEHFLDVAAHPTITYRGKLEFNGDEPTSVDGQLTLLGVTRPVKLTVRSFKCIPHPLYKKEYCGADAEGDFNRADFGMTYYATGELGKVHVRIQVEALKES
jgi:polyisoprenoid-binding protein YceI